MSGVLSLYRELYTLYHGTLPPQRVFWSCTWIAFVLAAGVLWWQEWQAQDEAGTFDTTNHHAPVVSAATMLPAP